MQTSNETLIKALRILASDIQSEDGVANAVVFEAAQRIEKLKTLGDELNICAKQIGWTSCEDPEWIARAGKAVDAWEKESKT